jgi:hypothetical protein
VGRVLEEPWSCGYVVAHTRLPHQARSRLLGTKCPSGDPAAIICDVPRRSRRQRAEQDEQGDVGVDVVHGRVLKRPIWLG